MSTTMPVLERNVEPIDDPRVEREEREPAERSTRPILTCDECGFSHEAGDGTWTRHDPNEPLWVYECPKCDHLLQVGGPIRIA